MRGDRQRGKDKRLDYNSAVYHINEGSCPSGPRGKNWHLAS